MTPTERLQRSLRDHGHAIALFRLERMLAEDAARGIVEHRGDTWALTPHAEASFGAALRGLADRRGE